MSIVKALINKESIRNQSMIAEYEKELKELPKGVLRLKRIGKQDYYYLYYRDGKKVISKYVGKDIETVDQLKDLLMKREHIETMLKVLKQEQEQIKKMEALI